MKVIERIALVGSNSYRQMVSFTVICNVILVITQVEAYGNKTVITNSD